MEKMRPYKFLLSLGMLCLLLACSNKRHQVETVRKSFNSQELYLLKEISRMEPLPTIKDSVRVVLECSSEIAFATQEYPALMEQFSKEDAKESDETFFYQKYRFAQRILKEKTGHTFRETIRKEEPAK